VVERWSWNASPELLVAWLRGAVVERWSWNASPELLVAWLRGAVVERWSLTGELSLSCARPPADG